MTDRKKKGNGNGKQKKNYEVGHGKPPKEYQFPEKTSGNPKGRPKGSKNFKTDAKEVLNEKVPVTNNGRTKKVSTQRAALMRLREKALNGDIRAIEKYLELARTYNDEDLADSDGKPLAASDEAILKEYLERQARHAAKPEESDKQTTSDNPLEDNDEPGEGNEDDDWLQ